MSGPLPRLPLPGEKPSGVWRPGRTQRTPWWRSLRLRGRWRLLPLIVVALLALAAWSGWRASATTVMVVANGLPLEVSTHARSVAGALRAAGLHPDQAVYIYPAPDTPLQPGMTITAATPRPVLLHADGRVLLVDASTTDPAAIARGAGIGLGPQDMVQVIRALGPTRRELGQEPALLGMPPLPREIVVRRPQTLVINEDGQRVSLQTGEPTLGEALSRAGYVLYEGDRIEPPLWTPLEGLLEVRIERGRPVTVLADDRRIEARTHVDTVGALLSELHLTPSGLDYTLPGLDAPVEAGLTVTLVRVREETLYETERLPFETVYVPDPELDLDQQRLVQAGQPGELHHELVVRYENDTEVMRRAAAEWVAREPQAHVVAYGTRIVIHSQETPYGKVEYWRTLRVLATSYSPLTAGHKQPGDPGFGIAAAGVEVQRGVVAVDPRVINLGTWMYIPGYGIGRALDTGGAVKGQRIDLGYTDADFFPRYEWIDIYLLTPVPPYDQINWVLPEDR